MSFVCGNLIPYSHGVSFISEGLPYMHNDILSVSIPSYAPTIPETYIYDIYPSSYSPNGQYNFDDYSNFYWK